MEIREDEGGPRERRAKAREEEVGPDFRWRVFACYILILVTFLSVQFGHGSNIGVAVSLPGDHKATNLALGSAVMVGVCIGLPLTPYLCRTFGPFNVCVVCTMIDLVVVLLMLLPNMTQRQIFVVRFLAGVFEAPLLPYLQEWLSRFGKHDWQLWNTVLHAMVPLGENAGYLLTQELVDSGISWWWAFAGQAAMLGVCCVALIVVGGRRYLDVSAPGGETHVYVNGEERVGQNAMKHGTEGAGGSRPFFDDFQRETRDDDVAELNVSAIEYPMTERWGVFWCTNVSLAAQLGFLSGMKYVMRDYATKRDFTLRFAVLTFSMISLMGPAIGGVIAMSGSAIRFDRWSQHRKTLLFLASVSCVAALLAAALPVVPDVLFWPTLFACFISAGGVYPAAQGIINIALTETRVIEASVYQTQCSNILFAMPLPYCIGKCMDLWGTVFSFFVVIMIQWLAACGFALGVFVSAPNDERSAQSRQIRGGVRLSTIELTGTPSAG